MINAAIFLVYEELLSRYEWKTNHSTTAVVNTLKNLHVYLVTTQITVRYSVSAASQSPSILNITSRHFSFHLAKWSFGYFSGALCSYSYKIKPINLLDSVITGGPTGFYKELYLSCEL